MNGQSRIPLELQKSARLYWQDDGERWLNELPAAIDMIVGEWGLAIERPLAGASTAYVALVRQNDGSQAILKIAHPSIIGEADALRAYGRDLAIEVVRQAGHALLLERCVPGTPLRDAADTSNVTAITIEFMRALWQCPPWNSISTLASQCEQYARLGRATLSERPELACRAFDIGLGLLESLPASATHEVVLHGDLHPSNILAATRRQWLVTDPKPLFGDPAYEPIQLICEPSEPDRSVRGAQQFLRRIVDVAKSLDLSPLRVAQWGCARRTDWALFCHRASDLTRANAAHREVDLFVFACHELGNEHT